MSPTALFYLFILFWSFVASKVEIIARERDMDERKMIPKLG